MGEANGCRVHDRRVRERVDQHGQVLLDKLLLEIDGVRGDHHPLVVGCRIDQRGQQVRDGLADAGASFHHEPLALVYRLSYGAGDGDLFGPLLEALHRLGQRAAGAQQRLDHVDVYLFDFLVGADGPGLLETRAELGHIEAGGVHAGGRRNVRGDRPLARPRLDSAEQVV